MQKRYFLALLVIPALILLTRLTSLATSTTTTQRDFVGQFSGDQEVPAVTSKARGNVTFQLSEDGSELTYKVDVSDIEHVTHMHLHSGQAGENGPPIVPVHPGHGHGNHGSSVQGEGVIRAADLRGPFANSTSLTSLVQAMEDGKTYVNIHTETFPQGEVRAQVGVSAQQ